VAVAACVAVLVNVELETIVLVAVIVWLKTAVRVEVGVVLETGVFVRVAVACGMPQKDEYSCHMASSKGWEPAE